MASVFLEQRVIYRRNAETRGQGFTQTDGAVSVHRPHAKMWARSRDQNVHERRRNRRHVKPLPRGVGKGRLGTTERSEGALVGCEREYLMS